MRRRTVIHGRPRVFVSSAIEALRSERKSIRDAVEQLGLADSWLFEWDALAAGQPAEEMYLQQARAADIFILVVGTAGSAATEAEYAVAYEDHPAKIIPFFLGPASPDTAALRKLIDSRHTRIRIADTGALSAAVAEATRDLILSGRFLSRACVLDLEARIARLRSAARLPDQFDLALEVEVDGNRETRDSFLSRQAAVLTGIGGSGKTHLALSHLAARARAGTQICLFAIAASEASSVPLLLEGAFDRYRFVPGEELVATYARDGRLCVAIDGIDDLGDRDRLRLLASIEWFHDRFPRSSLVLLSRSRWEGRLPLATRGAMGEMSAGDIGLVFAAMGYEGTDITAQIPRQLRDLVGRPFWAGLMAERGLLADNPVDMLADVVGGRIHAAVDGGVEHEAVTRATIDALALGIHPAVTTTYDNALRVLAAWQTETEVASRLSARPGQELLNNVVASGLVGTVDDKLVFIHPLFAAVCAASRLIALDRPHWTSVSDDIASFAATRLDEARAGDLVELVVERGLFFAGQYLRLSRARPRASDRGRDATRYGSARRRIGVASVGWSVLFGPSWTAVTDRPDGRDLHADVNELPLASDVQETYLIWQGNPFETATPEAVAIGDWVNDFKDQFLEWRPPTPNARHRREARSFKGDPLELEPTLLDFVIAERSEVRRLLAMMGPTGAVLGEVMAGEPAITIISATADPRYLVRWGAEQPSVEVVADDGGYRGKSIASVLANGPEAEAFKLIEGEIEQRLGTTLDSYAWRVPEILAAWSL